MRYLGQRENNDKRTTPQVFTAFLVELQRQAKELPRSENAGFRYNRF